MAIGEYVNGGLDDKPFKGTFKGKEGQTSIKGLVIDKEAADNQGLFGYASGDGDLPGDGAEIWDIKLIFPSIKGKDYVGGIVGRNGKDMEEDVSIGGGDITNCAVEGGTISGGYNVGGIVGDNWFASLKEIYNTGTVIGTGDAVGGVAGNNNGGVEGSCNTGDVSGKNDVGGVVGWNNKDGIVSGSYNTGAVSGRDRVGGVAGYNGGLVEESHNTGDVSGVNYVGGVVGWNFALFSDADANIEKSYNTGDVSGIDMVGGVVGYNHTEEAAVVKSYNIGTVIGTGYGIGGVVGENNCGTVSGSYNTGDVRGEDKVGGVAGWNYNKLSIVKGSYNTGAVSGTGDAVGGVVGSNNKGIVEGSYFNMDNCKDGMQAIGSGIGTDVEGLTTFRMTGTGAMDEGNMEGLDNSLWKANADVNNVYYYPTLQRLEPKQGSEPKEEGEKFEVSLPSTSTEYTVSEVAGYTVAEEKGYALEGKRYKLKIALSEANKTIKVTDKAGNTLIPDDDSVYKIEPVNGDDEYIIVGIAYKIIMAPTIKNGKIVTNPHAIVQEGENVEVEAVPDEGYKLTEGSLTVDGDPIVDNKFTMPAEDVTINAEFEKQTYDITYPSYLEGGIIEGTTTGQMSEQIEVTVAPEEGYKLTEGSLKANGTPIVDNKFTMPAKAVEVTGEFEKIDTPTPTPTPDPGKGGGGSADIKTEANSSAKTGDVQGLGMLATLAGLSVVEILKKKK